VEARIIAVATVCEADLHTGECKTSFTFQKRHMLRDVSVLKKNKTKQKNGVGKNSQQKASGEMMTL
jgi:hypothetical protein